MRVKSSPWSFGNKTLVHRVNAVLWHLNDAVPEMLALQKEEVWKFNSWKRETLNILFSKKNNYSGRSKLRPLHFLTWDQTTTIRFDAKFLFQIKIFFLFYKKHFEPMVVESEMRRLRSKLDCFRKFQLYIFPSWQFGPTFENLWTKLCLVELNNEQ